MIRYIVFVLFFLRPTVEAGNNVPIGVPFAKASLYVPSALNDFTCLDGSETIKFEFVNDNYCDCADGSDEPGTSACNDNTFFCANVGHAALQIPSSWVDDGVCDCCDGSDEYGASASGRGSCDNTCEQMGAAARLMQQQRDQVNRQGRELRQQLVLQAAEKLREVETRAAELQQQLTAAEAEQREAEQVKLTAEQAETAALEAFRQRQQEEETRSSEKLATETFHQLDTDQDGILSVVEMMSDIRFDANHDGVVSEQEVNELTANLQQVSVDAFVANLWPVLTQSSSVDNDELTASAPTMTSSPPPPEFDSETKTSSSDADLVLDPDNDGDVQATARSSQHEHDGRQAHSYDRDDDEDHEDDGGYFPASEEEDDDVEHEEEDFDEHSDDQAQETHTDTTAGSYDADTQAAVDAASLAREAVSQSQRVVTDLSAQLSDARALLDMPLGESRVYAALHKLCYSHNTHEYEYELCVFDKVMQKPKHGGVVTTLGRWGHWLHTDGGGDDGHMYDNGQQCWNGPHRSAKVLISCGLESQLVEVSEPSKCEYVLKFITPAACQSTSTESSDDTLFRDEL